MSDILSEQVSAILNEALAARGISPSDDFFDHGVTSLTVVELQIRIEKAVHVQVPTKELLLDPSIDGWIKIYSEAAKATC